MRRNARAEAAAERRALLEFRAAFIIQRGLARARGDGAAREARLRGRGQLVAFAAVKVQTRFRRHWRDRTEHRLSHLRHLEREANQLEGRWEESRH